MRATYCEIRLNPTGPTPETAALTVSVQFSLERHPNGYHPNTLQDMEEHLREQVERHEES
jgi:hypothetical protein